MSDIDSIAATTGGAGSSPAIDHSWHRFSDTSGPDLGVGEMGFSDMLDVINPLQHIPVVSAVYRAVTGNTISPAARIAGDALYGAAMGVASAGISALGAIGDEVFAAANGGELASETVVAALFGKSDEDKSIQLADNAAPQTSASPTSAAQAADPQTQAFQVAALQTPATRSPILDMPELSAATTNTPSATAAAIEGGKSLAPDRSKLAYGGVMDPAMTQSALQNQTLALSLAAGQSNLQAAHALRNARFATSTASPITNTTAQSASLPLPGETPSLAGIASPPAAKAAAPNVASLVGQSQNVAVTPAQLLAQSTPQAGAQPLPGGLRQSFPQDNSLKAIKGLDQYRSTAQRVPMPFIGGTVDVSN